MTHQHAGTASVNKVVVTVGEGAWQGVVYATARGQTRLTYHTPAELLEGIAALTGWGYPAPDPAKASAPGTGAATVTARSR